MVKYTNKKYVSKKRNVKKTVKRFANKGTKSLVQLIKRVSLKPAETKNTHQISENVQLNHNVPSVVYAMLNTTNSVNDNQDGTQNLACRVGDEVIARGLSFKFWFANKGDRPNVMYKIVFFKYQSREQPVSTAPFCIQGSSNYMIRDIDAEKYKIIKVVKFNIQTSAQRITATDTFNAAEGHRAVSVWIPLKNQKIKYENNSGVPRFLDYAYTIIAYDSYGTLTSDNIASYAVNRKFYFKDP